MVKIFNHIKKMDEYSVIFEPELFIAMKIKHVDKKNSNLFIISNWFIYFSRWENEKF